MWTPEVWPLNPRDSGWLRSMHERLLDWLRWQFIPRV